MNIPELIEKELNSPNYLIEGDGPYAVVYFSSLDIYKDDDPEDFKRRVIEKNNFEFYKTRVKGPAKHIFIRDINKCWYTKGVSNDLNSVEKIFEFLKREVGNKKLITVGSSSGGYAACLFGMLLKAEYILNFNGQFRVEQFKHSKYFDLRELMSENPDIPIFYMLSTHCPDDVEQWELVKDFENVRTLALKSAVHGVPVVRDILLRILASDKEALEKMYNYKTPIGEKAFIMEHFGLWQLVSRIVKKNIACFRSCGQ